MMAAALHFVMVVAAAVVAAAVVVKEAAKSVARVPVADVRASDRPSPDLQLSSPLGRVTPAAAAAAAAVTAAAADDDDAADTHAAGHRHAPLAEVG